MGRVRTHREGQRLDAVGNVCSGVGEPERSRILDISTSIGASLGLAENRRYNLNLIPEYISIDYESVIIISSKTLKIFNQQLFYA